MKLLQYLLALLVFISAALAAIWFGAHPSTLPCFPSRTGIVSIAREDIDLNLGLDASGSVRHKGYLPAFTLITYKLSKAPWHWRYLKRVDHDAITFDSDNDVSLESLVKELKRNPDKKKTFPRLFWEAVTEDILRRRRPAAIVFVTDGEDDETMGQAATISRVRDCAKRLADSGLVVHVAIVGADTPQRDWLPKALAPFKQRLQFYDDLENPSRLVRNIEQAMDTAPPLSSVPSGLEH